MELSASPTDRSAWDAIAPRMAINAKKRGGEGCGKDVGWKSPKTDFPTPLGNPAKYAGFPLSHSDDGDG